MAQIKRIRITRLAGRRRPIAFELNPDVNVFWGLNGTGKTSLLKILHSALNDDGSSLVRVPFTSAEVCIDRISGRQVVRTLTKQAVVGTEEEEEEATLLAYAEMSDLFDSSIGRRELSLLRRARRLDWKSQPTSTEANTRLEHRYLPISRVSDTTARPQRPSSAVLDEAAFDRIFALQIQEIWRDYNTQALVRIRAVQERGLAEVLSIIVGQERAERAGGTDLTSGDAYALLRTFFEMQHLRLKLPTIETFSQRYKRDGVLRNIVAEIADVQKEVEKALEPQHRIETLILDLFSGGKTLELGPNGVTISIRKETIPLESLSSGEKQMLRILLECVAAGGNCILIDEPELSMHVDWQHRLVECMRIVNPLTQIILATHSPEVMADLSDAHIFQL